MDRKVIEDSHFETTARLNIFNRFDKRISQSNFSFFSLNSIVYSDTTNTNSNNSNDSVEIGRDSVNDCGIHKIINIILQTICSFLFLFSMIILFNSSVQR
jgi:hypothetical protein